MKRKITVILAALILSTGFGSVVANAQEGLPQKPESITVSESTITPRADVIQTKFRDYYGKIQMRRWNATRGYWVDPYWITIA